MDKNIRGIYHLLLEMGWCFGNQGFYQQPYEVFARVFASLSCGPWNIFVRKGSLASYG